LAVPERRETRASFVFLQRSLFNSTRSRQDPIGLNISLYNEMDAYVRETFRNEIAISEEVAALATYFHGYLLEQTMQVFDISPLECSTLQALSTINPDAREAITRCILLTPKVLILKEQFYSQEGILL
jgi:hypothetical protein